MPILSTFNVYLTLNHSGTVDLVVQFIFLPPLQVQTKWKHLGNHQLLLYFRPNYANNHSLLSLVSVTSCINAAVLPHSSEKIMCHILCYKGLTPK